MLIIQDTLISEEIVEEMFACDLNACKGACCVEGDYGAPLEEEEMQMLEMYKDIIIENLPENSKEYLRNNSGYELYKDYKVWGTSCHDDGACVFMTRNEFGIAMCGIEKTWREGKIPFQKPISCHLYPIRISSNDVIGFEAWNYDRWDICSAACDRGKKERIPLYQFVKDAIIRKKGADFFEELDAAAQNLKDQK